MIDSGLSAKITSAQVGNRSRGSFALDSEQDKDNDEIRDDPWQPQKEGKGNPDGFQKKVMEGIDRAQIISGEWRMIEENCVLVGPFQSLTGQRLAENIESQNVVRTEGIPCNQKLCDERDSRGNKNSLTAIGATIANRLLRRRDRYFTGNGERCGHG